MFSTFRTTAIGAAALALAAAFALPAQATYIVTLEQVGAEVVGTGSGSLDFTGLTPLGGFDRAAIEAAAAVVVLGPTSDTAFTLYGAISGPTNFGTGSILLHANSGSGEFAGVAGAAGNIVVPFPYVSGTSLGTSTDTWNGATFASLGVTPGTTTWTWGTGAHADSFILEIGAVPEPASLTLLAVGLAGLGMAVRLRRA